MDTQLYHRVTIWKTVVFCLVLSAFSCAGDPYGEGSGGAEPGIPVQVEINFRVPKFDNPQTLQTTEVSSAAAKPLPGGGLRLSLVGDPERSRDAASARVIEVPLYNLWVLQFSADGIVRQVVRVSTDDNPVYESRTIEVELLTGSDQTIYMLALGRQYGEVDLSGIRSLDELEATAFDFIRYQNGLPMPVVRNTEDVPYCGSCDHLSIIQLEENSKGYVDYRNSDGFSGAVSMKALVALVTIDFSYLVENMTPFSISLNNVPTTFGVNSALHKPSQFVNLPAVLLDPSSLVGGKRLKMSWYAAPNPQGVVPTITSETDRYFYYKTGTNTAMGTAPRFGTYIHFWASKDTVTDDYAFYYLFLGSNTTTDFNIHPHSHYRYRTDINSADDLNDKRIVYKTLKQSVDFAASSFSYPWPNLSRTGSYDFDSHADMRPIEITALRGQVSVEILPGSDNGVATAWPGSNVAPLDPATSWLKLSTYPNYTAALEASRRGDRNALTTFIKLDASIPGLFRLYLYSDEYEKYVLDNPAKTEYKRSLFVRFTFRTDTDKSVVYTARMDQLPAFYLGEFGGEPSMANGEFRYPKGLVVETKKEYEYYRYLSYMPNSFYQYGAYATSSQSVAAPSDRDIRRYGAYDTYSGRRATILMAENRYNISPIAAGYSTLNRVEAPQHVNGHADLYQYKYYTNDGFAQRWCYDKNRDTNGNGYLDDDEVVWYMPSVAQILSLSLNCYNTSTAYLRNTTSSGIGDTYLHSITMPNHWTRPAIGLYALDEVNVSSTGSLTLRCVRDVEPLAGGPAGVRYYAEDNYAVIDGAGLMEGVAENRVKNPEVIIMPGAGDDATYTGRVIRHYTARSTYDPESVHTIDRKVSRRFRVAPCDVDIHGDPVPSGKYATMTWAEAAGYVTEANTLPVTTDKTAVAATGCAAYRGVGGNDAPGTWRLPTIREAVMLGMMDQVMAADNAVTGYIPLYYLDTTNFMSNYWIASEVPDGSGQYEKNRAFCFTASGRVKTLGGEGNPAAWSINSGKKSNKYQNLARCIQDLP